METVKQINTLDNYVTTSVHSINAQRLASRIAICTEPLAEVTPAREAFIVETERLIKRIGGTYKKQIEGLNNEITYGFNPSILLIPTDHNLTIRLLKLIAEFDQAIIAIESAWLNNKISVGQRGKTIRQLEGRVYRAIESLLGQGL